jgi:L-ascorbate metabolism protein UlaG (beta-lactamase superfamily)
MKPSPDITIRFLGYSGFQITRENSTIVVDPPTPQSGNIDGELVYCTHPHPDHTMGIKPFMENNPEAKLVANKQVTKNFKQCQDRTITINAGETYQHKQWEFQFIETKHGFLNPINMGVIIRNGVWSFGHPGDAESFEGFYSSKLKLFAVPIVGMFTASPNRAISELTKFTSPPTNVIVMHWFFRNPLRFCKKLSIELPETYCIIPKKGKPLITRFEHESNR